MRVAGLAEGDAMDLPGYHSSAERTPERFRWEVGHGTRAIDALASEWNALAHASDRWLTSDALFTGAAWGAFGKRDEALAIHALRKGDRLVAVLPLFLRGSVFPAWRCIRHQTPYWAFTLDASVEDAADEVLDHLLEAAPVLDVQPVHRDGRLHRSLEAAARARGSRVVVNEVPADALISLEGGWEKVRRTLSKNVQEQTPRRLRRLKRAGEVTFDVTTSGPSLPELLLECFHLETLGWKAVEGSPILASERTLRFYNDLADRSAAADRFALYTMRLDKKLIAFEYCLRAQRRIDMLKLSFDPEYSRESPGNVLRWWLLEREATLGEIASYHLGRVSDDSGWKMRWASATDPLIRLRIFGTGVRAAAAYQTGPRLRNWLRGHDSVRRAVMWARRVTGDDGELL